MIFNSNCSNNANLFCNCIINIRLIKYCKFVENFFKIILLINFGKRTRLIHGSSIATYNFIKNEIK